MREESLNGRLTASRASNLLTSFRNFPDIPLEGRKEDDLCLGFPDDVFRGL